MKNSIVHTSFAVTIITFLTKYEKLHNPYFILFAVTIITFLTKYEKLHNPYLIFGYHYNLSD